MARPGFSLDRKFKRLSRALDDVQAGFGEILARGSLELMWDTAYEGCDDYLGDSDDVEASAHWGGKAGTLTEALLRAGGEGRAGFIEAGGSEFWPEGKPGTYRVHDLYDHAPDYVQKRLTREAQREAKGKSITDLRREAGKKGAAVTHGKRPANGGQEAGNRQANGVRLPPESGQASPGEVASGEPRPATVGQIARTPSPAPAPTPAQIDNNPAEARWPLLAALLLALHERGFEGEWPRDEKTADRLEQAIRDVTLAAAIDRAWAVVEADRAFKVAPRTHLGWYLDAIRGKRQAPPRAHGDLGAELIQWNQRLSAEDHRTATAELRALARLDPDLEYAPLGVPGNPDSPAYEAVQQINAKWRAVAEARP